MPRKGYKRHWYQCKKSDESVLNEPFDRLVVAVYKQAINDVISKSASARDRKSAIEFLNQSSLGKKCLEQLRREGVYNGE